MVLAEQVEILRLLFQALQSLVVEVAVVQLLVLVGPVVLLQTVT
jgi:hypothetical protein